MKIINKYMAANRVLILAASGCGKSTSIMSLDPKETFIINVANKPLPFKGWKAKYTNWSKENPMGNLYASDVAKNITDCMDYVNSRRPEIKNLIVDDLFYVMATENFAKMNDKGYDKFVSMGVNFSNILTKPKSFREDLFVFYLTHPDISTDEFGNKVIKTKTVGKLVDNQLMVEGLFDKVLFARPRKSKEKGLEYGFETRTDGYTPTKTPMGMFEEDFIPNDLQLVRDAILEYEGATV